MCIVGRAPEESKMPRVQKILTVLGVAVLAVLVVQIFVVPHPPDPWRITLNRITKIGSMSSACWKGNAYWPTNLEQMVGLGMLRPKDTNDGWGRPFMYAPYSLSRMRGTVASCGSDGKPGGVGEAADVQMVFY